MAIDAYNSCGDLIYHLFGTDLLRFIFDLILTVSFEKLSSLCCNNTESIVSSSLAGQHLSRYPAVTLTSYMVRNINVNVNVDFFFTLFCELVGRLTILGFPVNLSATIAKSQALEIVYRTHAGAIEGVVGEVKSFSWGGARTKDEVHKRKLIKTRIALLSVACEHLSRY